MNEKREYIAPSIEVNNLNLTDSIASSGALGNEFLWSDSTGSGGE